jgi:hypothetical protein
VEGKLKVEPHTKWMAVIYRNTNGEDGTNREKEVGQLEKAE